MSNSPLVSIGLPVFNRQKFIGQSIKSILNQTHSNLELIIYDDFSTDKSWDIISGFKDQRIQAIKGKSNLGPPTPLNKILELAKGEYFIYLGDWDYVEPDLLANCIEAFARNPNISFVYPAADLVSHDNNSFEDLYSPFKKMNNGQHYIKSYLGQFSNFSCCFHPHSLFKVSDIKKRKKIYNDKYNVFSDVDLTLYALNLRESFIFLPKILVHIRQRDPNHFISKDAVRSVQWLYLINIDFIKNNCPWNIYLRILVFIKKEIHLFFAALIESINHVEFTNAFEHIKKIETKNVFSVSIFLMKFKILFYIIFILCKFFHSRQKNLQ